MTIPTIIVVAAITDTTHTFRSNARLGRYALLLRFVSMAYRGANIGPPVVAAEALLTQHIQCRARLVGAARLESRADQTRLLPIWLFFIRLYSHGV
jgi:hypothetical protein